MNKSLWQKADGGVGAGRGENSGRKSEAQSRFHREGPLALQEGAKEFKQEARRSGVLGSWRAVQGKCGQRQH